MRIKKLDGLRGLFSIMIIFLHYPKQYSPDWFYDFFIIRQSDKFVDFFFILSGFVISLNYSSLDSLKQLIVFIKKRFARLFPLLFFTSTLFFVLILISRLLIFQIFPENFFVSDYNFSYRLNEFFDGVLFLNSTPILGTTYGTNSPSWSISAEMLSYFAFGFITYFFSKRYKDFFFAIIIIISTVILYETGNFFTTIDYGFLRGFLGFSTGYFVYRISSKKINFNNILELLLTILLCFIFYFANNLFNQFRYKNFCISVKIPKLNYISYI
jgi:peptidoglycan/LPS O-acetylase OafA/YrhL